MAVEHRMHRLILRAELEHGGTHIIAHTLEISDALVFVHCEEDALIGDEVSLALSFPGLVEPFSVETQVIARHRAAPPGKPPGWTLGFLFYREAERTRLKQLIDQTTSMRGEPAGSPYRLLLVEDNPMMREAFAIGAHKIFGAAGPLAVDMAESGEDALDKLHSRSYDLAIVDYFLPVLTGSELIARLRREPALAGLPVFAISVGGPEVRRETLAAGADMFLQKPLVTRDLLGTLKQLMAVRGQDGAAHVQ